MVVVDILEEEEGVDACTKSFKLVDDIDETTEVLPVVILEVVLGVNVVLLVWHDDTLEIGTCFTVIVVPEGMFLVKFLFGIFPATDGGDFDVVALSKDAIDRRLSTDFLVISV